MSLKVIKDFPDIRDVKYNYRQWNRQFEEQNVILNGRFSYLYYPLHWTSLSLKFAFGGSEQYKLGNMKYSVNGSRYLILNRGCVYESLIDSESIVESLTLNFTKEFTENVFYSSFNNDEYLLDYPEVLDKTPVNFFQKLYTADKELVVYISEIRKAISSYDVITGQLNELMHGILENTFRVQLTAVKDAGMYESVKRSTKIELYNRLTKAKDYIESNYSENVTLQELSQVSSLCRHHLLRKFKSLFKQTPYQYLTDVRLERTKELLVNTNKSITEICQLTGYESLSSFSLLFRKKFAQTPQDFRKNYSKKSIFKQ